MLWRTPASGGWAVLFVAVAWMAFQARGDAQNVRGADPNLTYSRGQSVVPAFHGWVKNPDGTYDLHFGYLNRNWQEELDIPIGPDNTVSAPYGPDAGQPTHFLPRNNRWQFTVRVPPDFADGNKDVVWTLTSHGETYRAYGVIKPGYVQDEFGLQREFFGTPPSGGNKWPEVRVEGATERTARVGEPIQLLAVATDDGVPSPASRGDGGRGGARRIQTTGAVGGDSVRGSARGLRLAWYVFRGKGAVTFDPPQFKTWEDQRAAQDSPWSPGWVTPPIPEGNRWVITAIFREPGTFILRALAHDGLAWAQEDVTVTVTR